MADADVAITAGSGTKVDTRTVGAGTDEHRQVIVIGDPGTAAGVAPVDVTAGLKVDTELPAAAALSDANANPTTSMVGGPMLAYNGTTWERIRTASGVNQTPFGDPGQTGTTVLGYDGPSGNIRVLRMAAADALATNDMLGAAIMAYNGATMDRMRGTTANGLDVDVTRMPVASTATLANVASSATSVTLDAANSARLGLTIFNDSTSALYVKLGATASATSFTVKMEGGAYWEMPASPVYTGVIDGIWVTATGNARVTDITA